MLVTDCRFKLKRLEHDPKAKFATDPRVAGKVIVLKPEQPSNADAPILVTLPEKVTLVIPWQ